MGTLGVDVIWPAVGYSPAPSIPSPAGPLAPPFYFGLNIHPTPMAADGQLLSLYQTLTSGYRLLRNSRVITFYCY